MAPFISKKQMSEEEIKLYFISPAIQQSWQNIRMEYRITDGEISLQGNLVHRKDAKRADYVLYHDNLYPLAIVEAKDNNHLPSDGLGQAIEYAEMMGASFAYSSNGDSFVEFDCMNGQLTPDIPMDRFPTPDVLWARYLAEEHHGAGVTPAELEIRKQPNCTGEKVNVPRYYQQKAINLTLAAMARGEQRLLLVMATGTGKTTTAFQIVYRGLKSHTINKVLYLADRNFLVDQPIEKDFKPLENVCHKVNFAKDDPQTISSYQVFFALYQQLAGTTEDDDEDDPELVEKFSKLFRPDFFDLVIVDECHRGSAKKDSNWRRILDYFSSATHLGMTATPKETKYISNIDYFGEPLIKYSLNQGIQDGFLAPFRVVNYRTNISDGWRPYAGQKDIYGNEIPDRIYDNSDYDYNIVIEDRINEVAKAITAYLHHTGRMQKTIVFCAREDHALRMRDKLMQLNADMCRQYPNYVVRITGSDTVGKAQLDYFRSLSSPTPVIATTSKLLSTGLDCKMVQFIVLDQMIGSMTEFKQIVGRGTRLEVEHGKDHFTILDFRNVTRMFADPDWDGPIIMDPDFDPDAVPPVGGRRGGKKDDGDDGDSDKPLKPYVDEDGCHVYIMGATVAIYSPDGKPLRQENIIDYTKKNVIGEYASLENFIRQWTSENKKATIRELFRDKHGIDFDLLKKQEGMGEVDDFDFIAHVAFDAKPLTRRERANNVKKKDFLNRYSGVAREVLEALLDRYMNTGIYEIERTEILQLEPFLNYGKPGRIASFFGGKEGYQRALKELEDAIYEVG